MERLELLKKLQFGTQVAEEEVIDELESYFVETFQWQRIAKGEIDIIRGEKGAGKSAIYSLLMRKANEFVDRKILIVGAETPDSLTELWGVDNIAAIYTATKLVELGFFEARGSGTDATYWVPFLYRDALHLVQGRAEVQGKLGYRLGFRSPGSGEPPVKAE